MSTHRHPTDPEVTPTGGFSAHGVAAAVAAVGTAVAPVAGVRPAFADPSEAEPGLDQTTTSEEVTAGAVPEVACAEAAADSDDECGLAGVLDIDDLHETLGMDGDEPPDGRTFSAGSTTSTTPAVEASPSARPMVSEGMPGTAATTPSGS